MRKKLQCGLALFLCIIMAFSFAVVPAGAVVIAPVIGAAAKVCGAAVVAWLTESALEVGLQNLKDFKDGKTAETDGLIVPISALDSSATRTKLTHDYLLELAYDWNKTCSEAVGFTVDVIEYRYKSGNVYGVIAARIDRNIASKYLADGTGRLLYCDLTEETSGRWESEDEALPTRYLLPYIDLYNLAHEVGGMLRLKDNFYEIYNRSGEIYCNVSGYRFSAIYESDKTAVNQDRPTTGGTIIEGDTITNIENTYNEDNDTVVNNDYSQDIDIENMQQALPGGIINNIDNLIYDDNTKTYYVDSHDVTNNVSQNYFYQYHINYTSITYIGQTEEYNKRYELYYQLPDGRDSADLTREELEQLNVDIDVIPYVRSTDNVDVRSLYHFDADTRDSSYWNYITDFEWITGASLTYMESGAFNGALYLDENQHAFRMTMPQVADTAGDWTLQWRYYQSHTEAPVNDSSVYVGDKPVLTMDGGSFYTPAGDRITVIPTGAWNEVCIIRSGGRLHYYVNGVFYASAEDAHTRLNDIRFVFGRDQQTFRYFDELRFSRGALYVPGENYTPTSVPHDSNLALVLPTGKDVVVDEIGILTPGDNNLMAAYNRDDWGSSDFKNLEGSQGDYTPYYSYSEYCSGYSMASGSWAVNLPAGYPIIWDRNYLKWSKTIGVGSRITFGGSSFSMTSTDDDCYRQPRYSLSLPLFAQVFNSLDNHYGSDLVGDWQQDRVYTYSVVLDDHSYSSVTFQIVPCAANGTNATPGHKHKCDTDRLNVEVLNIVQNSEIQFAFEDYGLVTCGSWDEELEEYEYGLIYPLTCLVWNSTDGVATVAYTELVTGDAPEFEISFDTAIYDEGQLAHSPTLAVRTDVTITDYQIGGVRPSVPEKGQVWALVESGYITSLQVYTGSVWINCDGRIWTGQRWIPASSYNVITLQDMYDIVDSTQDYEYIYTESGFWGWLQKAWKDMIARFDRIIELMQERKEDSPDECQHVYDLDVDRKETCTEPGHYLYTCSSCGHTFTEYIDALGHDWPIETDGFYIYQQPQDVTAPVGSEASFLVVAIGEGLQYQWQFKRPTGNWLNSSTKGHEATYIANVTSTADGYQYRCKITDASGNTILSNEVTLTIGELEQPSVEDPVVHCSRCSCAGEIREGHIFASGTVLQEDVFDALGDLIADGITWLLDKATELVNALTGITDVFNRFVDRIGDLIGLYPAFLAAVFVLLSEDLTTVIWFGVIAFVVRAVWKKYNKS